MDDKEELRWRRKSIRLMLRGLSPRAILKQIPRSRAWLYKWRERFERFSWSGLKSTSRQPKHSPQAYSHPVRSVVTRLRRALQKRTVGLVGAKAIQHEIRQQRLLRQMPSRTTIKRWLQQEGLSSSAPPILQTPYYPQPSFSTDYVLHAMDWTARYLEGGEKVFIFHTVDAQTRALAQTLSANKSAVSWRLHALQAWQTLGLPHGLQLDNDTAASGGEKTPRHFSSFVRLCLYLGMEPIFTPPREPKRNGLVEHIHGLWAQSFWNRQRFHSPKEVLRQGHKFTQWYAHHYDPPTLEGLTPAQAQRQVKRQRLTKPQIRALPQELPITAGRLHFIRRVSAQGAISFLGETWKVGQRFAHHYVRATVITHRRQLEIYHRRSERATTKLVKRFPYEISEAVRRLRPEFKR